jgi:hypothetical protein
MRLNEKMKLRCQYMEGDSFSLILNLRELTGKIRIYQHGGAIAEKGYQGEAIRRLRGLTYGVKGRRAGLQDFGSASKKA